MLSTETPALVVDGEARARDLVARRLAHDCQEEIILRLLAAASWPDEETGKHVRRVGLLSQRLARAAGWSAAEAENIRLAAPMHDIGKVGVPNAILCKPGPLTPEEFRVMQTHTLIGAKILARARAPLLQMAEAIALHHHEHWDGGGYPTGRDGYAIPESARIVAIADVYDALTHDRVYRPAIPEQRALEMMREGAGTHFDPHLLAAFFLHLPEMSPVCENDPDESPVGPASCPVVSLFGEDEVPGAGTLDESWQTR
jgi:putative two-component system response regulator